MELRQVEAFLAVATFGSFKRAAESLNLTQPGISARIKALEHSLGVRLFERDPREGVLLSREGRAFRPYAEELMRMASRARLAVNRDGTTGPAVLHLACESYLCNWLVPQALRDLRTTHPTLLINVAAGSPTWVADQLRVGASHLAIGRFAQGQALVLRPLLADPLVVVAKKGAPLTPRAAIRGTDLADYPFVLAGGPGDRIITHGVFARLRVTPTVALEVETPELALRMVEYGIGLALLPWACVADSLQQRRVTLVRVRDVELPRTHVYLASPGDTLPALARPLAEAVRKAYDNKSAGLRRLTRESLATSASPTAHPPPALPTATQPRT